MKAQFDNYSVRSMRRLHRKYFVYPIHTVCGWRGEKVAFITVYIPKPPKFIDPWTRGEKSDEENSM
jgi:hypothetical protein